MTDTSSLSHLIERLEKATGPDRELDVEIQEAVVGLEMYESIAERGGGKCIRYYPGPPGPTYRALPRYTSSIDAAMTLALSGWIVESMSDEATGCVGELVITGCAVEVTNGSFTEQCIAATRPLATAGAWLKARSLPAI